MTVPDYDPLSAEAKRHTHELFAALRHGCPVHHHLVSPEEQAAQEANPAVAAPTTEFWSVLRFADCARVLQRAGAFSNRQGPGPERRAPVTPDGMLLTADDPAHRRQRQIANKGFLPRVVREQLPAIQATMDGLVDGVAARGRCEAMADLAVPLTVTMITRLFGVGGDRKADIGRWGQAVIAANGGGPDEVQAGAAALGELFAFLRAELTRRRTGVEDELPGDVLSALMVAEHEGSRFSDEEIGLAAMQFLSAGFETTATAIGSAVYLLCTHPDQRDLLVNDWSLVDAAVEEVLRFESPIEGTFRTTTESVEIAGVRLPPEAKVRVVYASANRDEDRFPDAGEFRIDRPMAELRGHIAFGMGPHACIGSALARAELRTAVETLLTRIPDLELDGPAVRNTSLTVNGFSRVPIRWNPDTVRPARQR